MLKFLFTSLLLLNNFSQLIAQTEESYKNYILQGNAIKVSVMFSNEEKIEIATFDSLNRLSTIENMKWKTTYTYAYNKSGKLISIISSDGNVAKFNYDARGLLISKIDIWGHPWKYKYDKKNRLIQESCVVKTGEIHTNTYIKYQYNDSGTLQQKKTIDSSNHHVTYEIYNTKGEVENLRCTSIRGKELYRESYFYGEKRNLVKTVRNDKENIDLTINHTYKFDEKGNWIACSEEKNNMILGVMLREIIYAE